MKRVLVAGVGNPLIGEDSCGLRFAEEIMGTIPGVDVRVLGRGVQALLHLASGYDVVVVVDASRGSTVRRIGAGDAPCGGSHGMGAVEVARLVAGLYGVEVYLFNCSGVDLREFKQFVKNLAGGNGPV